MEAPGSLPPRPARPDRAEQSRAERRRARFREMSALRLRDMRYWLDTLHYNEILKIQEQLLRDATSRVGGARASGPVLDERGHWRLSADFEAAISGVERGARGAATAARWDAAALCGLAVVALLLGLSRLLCGARGRSNKSSWSDPEDGPEPALPGYPPPYSEGPEPSPSPPGSPPGPAAYSARPGEEPPPPYCSAPPSPPRPTRKPPAALMVDLHPASPAPPPAPARGPPNLSITSLDGLHTVAI